MRLVVKIGTSTIAYPTGGLNIRRMENICKVLSDLKNSGIEIILVTSGAIAVGKSKLNLATRPKELKYKQAAAAVGQCQLMHFYDKFFEEYNHGVAQILLTDEDVADTKRAEHLKGTFEALMEMGIIPIVNENDSVSSAEIETGAAKIHTSGLRLSGREYLNCRIRRTGSNTTQQTSPNQKII